MKLSRKLILTLALVLSVAMATTGTLAYLTDRDSDANVFTIGNVDIQLNEDDFIFGSELVPNDPIDKSPTIENVGDKTAWVWGTISIPTALDRVKDPESGELVEFLYAEKNHTDNRWQWLLKPNGEFDTYEVNAHGTPYTVYTALWSESLEPENETSPLMTQVTLHEFADITENGDVRLVRNGKITEVDWNIKGNPNPTIFVSAYAIQREGFENVGEAYDAYMEQWGPFVNDEGDPGEGADYDWPAVPVSTEEELIEAFNNNLGGHIRLTQDIQLTEDWEPIGSKADGIYFTGILDGDGHKISGLNIENGNYAALIAAAKNATIKNLKVEGTVSGENVAGLVARMEGGSIEDCSVDVNVTGEVKAAGVVAMVNGQDSYITNCYNYGDITVTSNNGNDTAGGIVAFANWNMSIDNCENHGNVAGADYSGGIVGFISGNSGVSDEEQREQFVGYCKNDAEITARKHAGGIVGHSSVDTLIEGCTSTTQNVLGSTNANVTIQ